MLSCFSAFISSPWIVAKSLITDLIIILLQLFSIIGLYCTAISITLSFVGNQYHQHLINGAQSEVHNKDTFTDCLLNMLEVCCHSKVKNTHKVLSKRCVIKEIQLSCSQEC